MTSASGSASAAPLTGAEVENFEKNGFVMLRGAFDHSLALRLRDAELWPLLAREHGALRDDPATWPHHAGVRRVFTPADSPEWAAVLSPRLCGAIDQLLGGQDRWVRGDLGLGWWAVSWPETDCEKNKNCDIVDPARAGTDSEAPEPGSVRGAGSGAAEQAEGGSEGGSEATGHAEEGSSLKKEKKAAGSVHDSEHEPGEAKEAKTPREPQAVPQARGAGWGASGAWHVDGSHFMHRVDSREQGLLPIFLFSDIGAFDGGTALAVGSHLTVAGILAAHAQAGGGGLAGSRVSRAALASPGVLDDVEEVRGRAGDVCLVHPFLLHARGTNLGRGGVDSVRFICNPCVALTSELRLDHADPALATPVERPVMRAVLRQALPLSFGKGAGRGGGRGMGSASARTKAANDSDSKRPTGKCAGEGESLGRDYSPKRRKRRRGRGPRGQDELAESDKKLQETEPLQAPRHKSDQTGLPISSSSSSSLSSSSSSS